MNAITVGLVSVFLAALVGCTPEGSEGGSCHNALFDTTSCDEGLECIDTCTGVGPPVGCGLICESCDDDVNEDGVCAGAEGEGEGEGEGE